MPEDKSRREFIRYYAMTGSAALATSLAGCSGDGGDGGGDGGDGGGDGGDGGGDGGDMSKVEQWREGAKDEDPLTVATTIDPNTINEFGDAVNDKFDFLEFRPLDLPPEELESRYISEYESGNSSIDIVMSRAWAFINEGMTMDLTQLPNYADLPEEAKGGDDWASYKFLVISAFYNTDLMSADEAPEDWEDIMDSQYDDEFIISTSARPAWIRWMEENVDEDFIENMSGRAAEVTNSSGTAIKKLASGVHAFNPYGFTKYLHIGNRAGGAPVENVCRTLLAPATIIGNPEAPNPNSTKFFLNWYFSPEAAELQAEAMPNECMGTADELICNPDGLYDDVTEPGTELISDTVDVVNLDRESISQQWQEALLD